MNRPVVRSLILFLVVGFISLQAQKKDKEEQMSPEVRSANVEALFTEGEKFFVLEDYEKALHYFQRAVALDGGRASIHYKLAETLSKSEKQEDAAAALTHIEQAIRLDPNNKFIHLLGAKLNAEAGNLNRATAILESMIANIPGTSESLEELANYYQFAQMPDKALNTLERAEAIVGVNEHLSLRKINLLSSMGRGAEAEAEGRKLMSAYPDEPRHVMAVAGVMAEGGKVAEAIRLLETFVTSNGDDGFGRLMLSELLFSVGQRDKAIEVVMPAMDNPDIPVENKVLLFKTFGSALEQEQPADVLLGEQLIRLLQRMKRGAPSEAQIWLAGGDLYLALNRGGEAREHYLRAIRLGSMEFQAWSNLLVLDSRESQGDSLIRHSEEAMEYYPNQAQVWFFNGYGYFYKRQFKKAVASLEQAKRLTKEKPLLLSIHELLGDAYHQTGDHERSDQNYDAVLTLDPDNAQVLNNYSFYLAIRKAKLEIAERMAEQLIRLQPVNASFLDTYAWVLFARGKYKEARKVIETVIASGNANAVHLEHYGDILFQLGSIDEAVKQWELALSMNSRNEVLRKKILNRKLN
ncbi:MAG: tetratricopeptide repeat protein [Bacteroidota bacterium]